MKKQDFLHEMKEITTVAKALNELKSMSGQRESDKRIYNLYHNLLKRCFKLLDYAHEYIPEEEGAAL